MLYLWLYVIAAGLCGIALLRLLFLLLFRRAVQATTCSTGLTEFQRRYDAGAYRPIGMHVSLTEDDIPYRCVLARVVYSVDGVERRADVRLLTPKGKQANRMPVIWYDPADPADPARVTGFGPSATLPLFGVSASIAIFGYYWSI